MIIVIILTCHDKTRKGWFPRTGKGQRFMGKEVVNGNISGYWVWKRLMSQFVLAKYLCLAKIISPNKNPPSKARGLSMSIAKPMKVE